MIEKKEINLSKNFHLECSLLLNHDCMYSSIIDAIFEDYAHFYDVNSTSFFSKNTLVSIRLFVDNLKRYLHDKPYSNEQVFVYLDKDWHQLLERSLIPTLKQIEEDLLRNKIEFAPYSKNFKQHEKPSNSAILERVTLLYKLIKTE